MTQLLFQNFSWPLPESLPQGDPCGFSYGSFDNLNLGVEGGSVVHIIGANGIGKSTLLKYLHTSAQTTITANFSFGLPLKKNSSLQFQLETLPAGDSPIAYLPQNEHIKWHLPVSLEEMLPRKFHPSNLKFPEGLSWTHYFREHQWRHSFEKASGGERKKILFLRQYLLTPQFFFLDEPFNHLDTQSLQQVLDLLKLLLQKKSILILVSHEDVSPFFNTFSYHRLLLESKEFKIENQSTSKNKET